MRSGKCCAAENAVLSGISTGGDDCKTSPVLKPVSARKYSISAGVSPTDSPCKADTNTEVDAFDTAHP